MAKNRDGLDNSNDWATPEWLYDELNAEFGFDFDPCPYKHDISEWDGLEVEWGSVNFVNPPYDRVNKPKFIEKAVIEWKKGKTVVMVLPVSTSTKQFHELILPNAEVRFLKGRVKFLGENTKGEFVKNSTPKHDTMVVIFRK